jgi:SNF2 family DNA or RNA helicase|tara:strand:+ start:2216 stop:3931 length:1716 start_codon:yes stop_codon:yes gene_type:complete
MTSFGTLEFVLDRYSGTWCWKISGVRAVNMVSKLIPRGWYGDKPYEIIVSDNDENIKKLNMIDERYPFEILAKSVWKRKIIPFKIKKQKVPKIEKLSKATPGKQFRGKLLEFQREGLDFLLKSSGHALLADEMGLGKTVQTLAYLSKEDHAYPALIIAPLVTLTNWQREIEKFLKKKSKNGKISEIKSPSSVMIRHGKKNDIGQYDFYIINYELLHKRFDDLMKLNIRTVVCDEVQHLRSKTTQKYAAVKKLAAKDGVSYRIGLSGTPIYNRGSEIWSIVDILKPGLLGSFKEFCEYFCYVNDKGKAIVLENKRTSLRNQLTTHVMLRRKKSDVLKELKDKVRYPEVIAADEKFYKSELDKIWKKLEQEQKYAETSFDKSASYHRAIESERQAAGLAKLPHVINFVNDIMEIDESVVVFCHHRAIHDLLHKSLSKYEPSSIIGGQTDQNRQNEIDRFQNGQTKLMIAGLRAGNVGINLTTASYVIFAELDWSPAIHRQAEDRLHRIGQKNTVFAYYLVGNGTLDEHVADILVDKSYEIDSILDAKTESFENKERAKLILAQIHDKLNPNNM